MAAFHQSTLITPFGPSHLQLGCNGVYLALPVARSVGIWSLQSLASQPLVLEAHKKRLSCLCFGHLHNPTLLCSAADDYVIVWNVEQARSTYDQGDQIRGQIIGQCLGNIRHCSFSYDDCLVAVCIGSEVLVLETKFQKLDTRLEGHTGIVNCAEFSPFCPSTLVSVSEDRTFKIWDISIECLVYQSCIISGSPFISLEMNHNNESFAVGTSDGQVRVYDMTEGNGYRCLHHLDVAKVIERQREVKELEKKRSVAGPKTISSRPAWQRSEQCLEDEDLTTDDADLLSEAGAAILGLHFTSKVLSDEPSSPAVRSEHPPLLPDDSLMEELLDQSPMLIIGTTGALLQINMHNYELASFLDFQVDSIPSEEDQHYITVPGSVAFAQTINKSQTWCILGSAFENSVDVIKLTCPASGLNSSLLSLMDKLSVKSTECEGLTSAGDIVWEQLTVIASAPVNEKSILRSEMTAKSKDTDSKSTAAGKAASKRSAGTVKGVQDQALTFKSKIKSSGYSEAPRRKMFSPKTNATKTIQVKERNKRSAQNASRSAVKQYPADVLPPSTVKIKIDVGDQCIPINSVCFSGDGQNLACALANKSAQLFKMPLTGKGTSFTGHNAAVNSVCWSHSNQWLLTASEDKTARIWSKSLSSDPLLTLSHKVHSVGADKERSNVNDKGNNCIFTKEIGAAQFYYVDRFILLTSGNSLYLYKYIIDSSLDDVKRYQSNSRYKLVRSFQYEQAQQITALSAVNGFHSYIVMCAGSDKSLRFLDMNVGRCVRMIPDSHTRSVHRICQNEGSAYVSHPQSAYDLFLTAAVTDAIKLWDVRTIRCVRSFEGHKNRAHQCGVGFSPCAKYIATGSEDKSVYIFDIRSGTYLHKLSGHTDVVRDVAFHPLYPELVTASLDGKVRLYSDR